MNEAQIITANNSLNGEAVYLTSCDAWTTELAFAEVLEPEDHDWRLAFANRLREVSGATLKPVITSDHGIPHLLG